MYFISIVIFTIVIFVIFTLVSNVSYYLNFTTLIFLISIFFPLMFSSGLLKDFKNAFTLTINKKKKPNTIELNNSYNAILLAIKLTVISGMILIVISAVAILANINNLSKMGPFISISILSLLYTLITIIIILPVQYKLKSMMYKKSIDN